MKFEDFLNHNRVIIRNTSILKSQDHKPIHTEIIYVPYRSKLILLVQTILTSTLVKLLLKLWRSVSLKNEIVGDLTLKGSVPLQ